MKRNGSYNIPVSEVWGGGAWGKGKRLRLVKDVKDIGKMRPKVVPLTIDFIAST